MARLEQTRDGNYIIRDRISKTNSFVTWQVRGEGVTYLNRRGIYAGYKFEKPLLLELIERNLVFTNSSPHPQKVASNVTNTPKSIASITLAKTLKTPILQTSRVATPHAFKSPTPQNARTPIAIKKTWPDLESLENLPQQRKRRRK